MLKHNLRCCLRYSALVGALLVGTSGVGAVEENGGPASPFALDGRASILEERHCGIVNGRLTVGIPFKDVARIEGLWAPPYVSSDFELSVSVHGQSVSSDHYTWWPFQVRRTGSLQGIRVTTATVLVPGKRAGVLAVTLENPGVAAREIAVQFAVRGTLDRNDVWEFAAPTSHTATRAVPQDAGLLLEQGDLGIAIRSAGAKGPGDKVAWDAAGRAGRASFAVPPGGRTVALLVFAVGPKAEAVADCAAIAADPEAAIRQAQTDHVRQVRDLFAKIPRLEANNQALVRLYERSLVHLLMNRWDVPEFVLRPYYATGSVRGGCVCNYLWNFGEVWELLPLVDPAADREHVKQFLRTDLTAHFAFLPTTGKGFGPWYMVNQEKIVGLVYYYVKQTGDAAFLSEVVEGKTILQHVIAHALFGDDPAKPVALIDYGPSNSHLELRRGLPYNHTMPDLNGRRYANYLMASRLAEAAGKPAPDLLRRAEALKTLLKKDLWNPKTRWFDFRDAQGLKQTRYTIQMFKLVGSGVLDAEEESGLLGHLNQREFLSEFGIHSMSKLDAAYDQADVDNGGGGSCTCFPPQIAERLYKAGRPEQAEDVLRRILWWGQRMPYWGDSLVADQIDYRKDTPLQCTLDGATVAQCILFGMFGIDAQWDGTIRVSPRPPAFSPQIRLQGLKLRGKTLDIDVRDGQFLVEIGGREMRAPVGQTVIVQNDGTLLPASPTESREPLQEPIP